MVKIGETKSAPLGLGQIELIGKDNTIHIKITGMGFTIVDTDCPPAEARAILADLRKTYTPELDKMAEQVQRSSGMFATGFIRSGKDAIREIEEWLMQVEGK